MQPCAARFIAMTKSDFRSDRPHMRVIIRRRDRDNNLARFYALGLQGCLDLDNPGTVAVLREWGRIGSPGTVRLDIFPTIEAAEAAAAEIVDRKRRKGYR